ncbi:hypothetical protein BaRGS_00037562, partial [Batillaria attramentaria]
AGVAELLEANCGTDGQILERLNVAEICLFVLTDKRLTQRKAYNPGGYGRPVMPGYLTGHQHQVVVPRSRSREKLTEGDTSLRDSIPAMSKPVAITCLVLNVLLPGLGETTEAEVPCSPLGGAELVRGSREAVGFDICRRAGSFESLKCW